LYDAEQCPDASADAPYPCVRLAVKSFIRKQERNRLRTTQLGQPITGLCINSIPEMSCKIDRELQRRLAALDKVLAGTVKFPLFLLRNIYKTESFRRQNSDTSLYVLRRPLPVSKETASLDPDPHVSSQASRHRWA
jgi:hypothetical protein